MPPEPASQRPVAADELVEALGAVVPTAGGAGAGASSPFPGISAELIHRQSELSPSDEARRHLKRSLAEAAGRVAEAITLLDANAGEPEEVEALLDAAESLLAAVESRPSLRPAGGPRASGNWQAGLTDRSPVSGQSNPVAPPLVIDGIDADGLHGHAVYGYRHEGPIESAHGGVIAAAFDEMVGIGQAISGLAGVTGTLTVRMRQPTPLHRRIDYAAGVDRVEGRKIFVWARSSCDGTLCAEAEAIMIVPRDGTLQAKYDWSAKADHDPADAPLDPLGDRPADGGR